MARAALSTLQVEPKEEKRFLELDQIDDEMRRVEARERLLLSSKSPANMRPCMFTRARGHAHAYVHTRPHSRFLCSTVPHCASSCTASSPRLWSAPFFEYVGVTTAVSAPCLFPRLKVPLHQGKGGSALAVKEAQEGKRRAKERGAEERSVRAPPLGRSQSHGRTREEEARQNEARRGRRKQGALSERTSRTDRRSEGPLNGERNFVPVPKRGSPPVRGDPVQAADAAEATSRRSIEQVALSHPLSYSSLRVEPRLREWVVYWYCFGNPRTWRECCLLVLLQ